MDELLKRARAICDRLDHNEWDECAWAWGVIDRFNDRDIKRYTYCDLEYIGGWCEMDDAMKKEG